MERHIPCSLKRTNGVGWRCPGQCPPARVVLNAHAGKLIRFPYQICMPATSWEPSSDALEIISSVVVVGGKKKTEWKNKEMWRPTDGRRRRRRWKKKVRWWNKIISESGETFPMSRLNWCPQLDKHLSINKFKSIIRTCQWEFESSSSAALQQIKRQALYDNFSASSSSSSSSVQEPWSGFALVVWFNFGETFSQIKSQARARGYFCLTLLFIRAAESFPPNFLTGFH